MLPAGWLLQGPPGESTAASAVQSAHQKPASWHSALNALSLKGATGELVANRRSGHVETAFNRLTSNGSRRKDFDTGGRSLCTGSSLLAYMSFLQEHCVPVCAYLSFCQRCR